MVEGVATTERVRALARRLGVEMPICDVVYRAWYEELPPKEALAELQVRPLGVRGGLVGGD